MTEKEVLKLALEALERLKAYGNVFRFRQDEQNPYDQACEAIAILRTAIEQAEKQVCVGCEGNPQGENIPCAVCGATPQPQQDKKQEPVALPEKTYEFVHTPEPAKWHHPECEGECIACLIEQVVQKAYGSQGLGYLQRHLTSPPAQRKPLTDEEIWDEVKAADLDWQTGWSLDEDASNRYITFARAIEAAHGIKE